MYIINSPVQKIGLLLSAFNSVANPFVYVLLMPAFRDSLRKTFRLPPCCGGSPGKTLAESSNTGTSGSDMVTAGAAPVTDDTNGNVTPETATPDDVQVEMTPVTHTAWRGRSSRDDPVVISRGAQDRRVCGRSPGRAHERTLQRGKTTQCSVLINSPIYRVRLCRCMHPRLRRSGLKQKRTR